MANSNPAFPVLLTDGDGNIQDIEGIQRLGGWVEELDEDYRVRSIYGEKKTETTQYTPEFLLEWTDQKSGNSAFHLYWQKKITRRRFGLLSDLLSKGSVYRHLQF